MKTVAVTLNEGGNWIDFEGAAEKYRPYYLTTGFVVHSIKFEDGSVWDAVNGWRKQDAG